MTNDERAQAARDAIEAYRRVKELDGESLGTVMQDFLCDLRHLCDREGLAYHGFDRAAHQTYLEEKHEEE
jgi:rhamnogalacturonyl hydrolase YesR